MVGRVYVRDIELLQDLAARLGVFARGSSDVLGCSAGEIDVIGNLLRSRTAHWQAQYRRREAALRACRSDRDKKRSCGAEAALVEEAQAAIERLHQLSIRFEQALGEHLPYSNRLKHLVGSQLPKASADLSRSIQKYQSYLSVQSMTSPEAVKFIAGMAPLSNVAKGGWGERAVVAEAKRAGHDVLLEHSANPNLRGFDCVSFDRPAGELHIWEAKNLTTGAVSPSKLSAWEERAKERLNAWPNKVKGDRLPANWNELMTEASKRNLSESVIAAVNEGRVTYHLRLGPETKLSAGLQRQLDRGGVTGANYDWKRYAADFLLDLGLD